MAQPNDDLLSMRGMDDHTAHLLASHGIKTREELAEQSVDELLEIEGMTEERAKEIIMIAREMWFDNSVAAPAAPAAGRTPGEAQG